MELQLDQILKNIEYLKTEENRLISMLEKEHQIVDAQNLLEALVKRNAFNQMLKNFVTI